MFLMQDLVAKKDFDNSASSLNSNIAANKTSLLKMNQKKLKTFDSSYFIGKNHFEEDGTQNYLVFQSLKKYFKVIAGTDYVSSWKSKGLSAETIKLPSTFDNSLTPSLSNYDTKTKVKVTGSSLKQPNISYTHSTIVKVYIV